MLSKETSTTIFWVFGMTRPRIEPRFPGLLVNTRPAIQIGCFICFRSIFGVTAFTYLSLFLSLLVILMILTSGFAWKIIESSRLGLKNKPTVSLQRRKTPPRNECPGYDIEQSDGEDPVLEIWEMWSTSSLLLLPRFLLPDVVVTVWKQMTFVKLNC